MRTLLVGDVHGCSGPLRRLIAAARPDRLVLLGDLFTKGPDPRGVWEIIQEHGAESVIGNHDARMLTVWGTAAEGGAARACAALPEAARDWLAALPLFLPGDGWLAVHAGLHPHQGMEGTTRKTAITVRRWPDDENPQNPFWWQIYAGPGVVLYGHDAVRGVQIHPRTIGLDSGCCYGGPLSGWLWEESRLYQEVFSARR